MLQAEKMLVDLTSKKKFRRPECLKYFTAGYLLIFESERVPHDALLHLPNAKGR